MQLWKSILEAKSKATLEVTIKGGTHKNDALSSLLFCIGLNPLSQILSKSGYGYRLRSGVTISHLLYVHDIKLYAGSERDIDLLIHFTSISSGDIGMSFGLDKCGRRPMGTTKRMQGGQPQPNTLQRVRQLLRSQLNGRNKKQAINSYALPIIRYPAGKRKLATGGERCR